MRFPVYLLLSGFLLGCVVPLGSISKSKAPVVAPTLDPRCDSIDRERSMWTLAAAGLGLLAGGGGLSSIPVKDQDVRDGIAVGSAISGGLSAIAGLVAAERTQRYVKLCQ